MAIKEAEYLDNILIVKTLGYGDNRKLKAVFMRHCKNAGVEAPTSKRVRDEENVSEEKRLAESVSRSKRMINEYAICNKFDFFFTGTLDEKKYNRYDLESFHKDLMQWIRNLNRIYKCDIGFIIVPEQHKDGAFHVHGLLRGIPEKMLHRFVIGDTMGKAIADKVKACKSVYNWKQYSKKYGFCSLEPIRNTEAISKYMTKYITKDLVKSVPKGKQSFWHSKDLRCAEVIMKGEVAPELPFEPDYKGEYASVTTFEDSSIMRDSLESLYIRKYGDLYDR